MTEVCSCFVIGKLKTMRTGAISSNSQLSEIFRESRNLWNLEICKLYK